VTDRAVAGDRTDFQWAAWLFGVLFVIVGVLGFIPGVTTNYHGLWTFDGTGAKELRFIGVNVLENIVHLLYGVAGILLSRTWDGARTFFLGGGLIFLVLWLYGLIIDLDTGANFLGVNTAANWVHFALGLAMLIIGAIWGRPYAPQGRVAY
jgi:Domain of unknown function (DUF4383)